MRRGFYFCYYLKREGLADQGFQCIDNRRRKYGYQNRVKSKRTNRFTQIKLVVFTLQRDDDQPADNQAAKMEVGEARFAGCAVLGETERCGGQQNKADEKTCLYDFFHYSNPPR